MSLNNLPTVSRSKSIDCTYFKIRQDCLKIHNQPDYLYYTLETRPYAIMVIATTLEGRYIINREYRHPTESILLAAPGGVLHDGEDFLECAKRELLEETGYTAERFELLGESFPFPGVCMQRTVFVRAYNAYKECEPALEHAEFIETELFTEEELEKQIQNSPLDGVLLSGLYLAKVFSKS